MEAGDDGRAGSVVVYITKMRKKEEEEERCKAHRLLAGGGGLDGLHGVEELVEDPHEGVVVRRPVHLRQERAPCRIFPIGVVWCGVVYLEGGVGRG